MKSFGQYFKYHFKSTFLRFAIIMVIALTLSLLYSDNLIGFREYYRSTVDGILSAFYTEVFSESYALLFATLCAIVPILELSGFKNRRNLDTIFSLPISRTKMLMAHALNGWIQITSVLTVEILVIFSALRLEKDYVNESYVWGYYGTLLVLGLCVYLFYLCVFSQANTVIDGIAFMFAWSYVFRMALIWFVRVFALNKFNWFNWDIFSLVTISVTPLYSFESVGDKFDVLIEGKEFLEVENISVTYFENAVLKTEMSLIFWLIIGVASILFLYFTFNKQRVEKVEDISSSPFGYKFLIPFYILLNIMIFQDVIAQTILLIVMLVLYIIYRRTIKIKKWDLLMLGIAGLMLIMTAALK